MSSNLLSTLTRQVLFAPLASSGRTEVILDRLRTAVALGVLAEGEQLPPEAELAAQLNVAPVTLREALGILRDEGILETRRGRGGGSFVRVPEHWHLKHAFAQLARLSPLELRDLTDWRCAVSATAAYFAAERASDQDVTVLSTTADHLVCAEDEVAARRADARFHIELAAAAQSARLSSAAISLQVEFAELLTLPYQAAEARKDVGNRLCSVAESVRAGAADQAHQRMREAVMTTRELLLEFRLDLTDHSGEEASP